MLKLILILIFEILNEEKSNLFLFSYYDLRNQILFTLKIFFREIFFRLKIQIIFSLFGKISKDNLSGT